MTPDKPSKDYSQMDPNWYALEEIVQTTDESVEQQTSNQNLPSNSPDIPEGNMDEQIDPATIKQESPKPIKCEPEEPEPESSKKISPPKLPLSNIDEEIVPATMEQESPEHNNCEPEPQSYKNLPPSNLPFKKRKVPVHIESPKVVCPECDRTFKPGPYLNQHYRARHGEPSGYRCEICKMKFPQREQMEKHKLSHKEENKRFVCNQCQKKYYRKSDLNHHVKVVHGEKKYKCRCCGKDWQRPDQLKAHEERMATKKTKRKNTRNKGPKKK